MESPALKTGKMRRANARTQLGKAQIAAARALRLHETALATVKDLEVAVSDSQAEQGRQLAAQITAGGPSPSHAQPPREDRTPALSVARGHMAITAEALRSLDGPHAAVASALEPIHQARA